MKRINDISFWQISADFKKLKALSDGVILRAGQGVWHDTKFSTFRVGAIAANFPFGNYWYYDNRYSPKRQAEKWASIIGNAHGELGCWIDLEDSQPGEYGTYKHWYDFESYFWELLPHAKVGIYTRAEYFNARAPALHVFRDKPLWIAHYGAVKPDIPRGWKDWTMWQYSSSGDGRAHGVGSHEIDMNWYQDELGKSPTLEACFGNTLVEYQKK